MSKLESAPMLKLAWVPAVHAKHGSAMTLGMTFEFEAGECLLSTVIPLKSGTHASLRLRSAASEAKPAEMWVLGTSPRMTVECAAHDASTYGRGGVP